MDAPTVMDSASETQTPQTDVAGWISGFRMLLTFLAFIFAWQALRFLLKAPGFERVFEDMLGDKNKLPAITKFVIENWMVLTMGSLFVNLVGIVCLWTIKRGVPACGAACVVLMFDYCVFEMTLQSLLAPMAEIVKQLSSGA